MTDDIPDYDIDELLNEEPGSDALEEMDKFEIARKIHRKGKVESDTDNSMMIRCPAYSSRYDHPEISGFCVCTRTPMATPDGDMKMVCQGPAFRYDPAEEVIYNKTDYAGISQCPYDMGEVFEK